MKSAAYIFGYATNRNSSYLRAHREAEADPLELSDEDIRAAAYLREHQAENRGRKVAEFNPQNRDRAELPTIFAFSNVVGGGDGIAYNQEAFERANAPVTEQHQV